MKKSTSKIWIISLLLIVCISISIFTLIKFNVINIEAIFKNCSFFARNIIQRGDFDEEWDFDKIVMPNKSGYYDWRIGLKNKEVAAVRVSSDNTVVLMGKEKLNMNYKSKEDYYKNGGPVLFRAFIEENSK